MTRDKEAKPDIAIDQGGVGGGVWGGGGGRKGNLYGGKSLSGVAKRKAFRKGGGDWGGKGGPEKVGKEGEKKC